MQLPVKAVSAVKEAFMIAVLGWMFFGLIVDLLAGLDKGCR